MNEEEKSHISTGIAKCGSRDGGHWQPYIGLSKISSLAQSGPHDLNSHPACTTSSNPLTRIYSHARLTVLDLPPYLIRSFGHGVAHALHGHGATPGMLFMFHSMLALRTASLFVTHGYVSDLRPTRSRGACWSSPG